MAVDHKNMLENTLYHYTVYILYVQTVGLQTEMFISARNDGVRQQPVLYDIINIIRHITDAQGAAS